MSTTQGQPVGVKLDIDMSDHLARVAADNGWTVRRTTTRYFTAERTLNGVKAQLGVNVAAGKLSVSRITVLATTEVPDIALQWLQEPERITP